MYANQVATEAPDELEYCWSQMAMPELGDGDGGGGGGAAVEARLDDDDGGDEEGVIDAEDVVIFEVVVDVAAAPDPPDCTDPIAPDAETEGCCICVSGQEPSLFPYPAGPAHCWYSCAGALLYMIGGPPGITGRRSSVVRLYAY